MQHDDEDGGPLEGLAALPREIDPGLVLEERTVRALRQAGLLQPSRRRMPGNGWTWAAAAVLALVLFSAGFLLGRSGSPSMNSGAVNSRSAARDSKPGRDPGVAREQKASGRDVTVATGTGTPQNASPERYIVWF